jgi:hypothetical protein
LLLGAFFPLVLVVGLASLIALAIVVREIRMLIGTSRPAGSQNRVSPREKPLAAKTRGLENPSYGRDMQEKGQSAREKETNRVEILERESDNEWLAEIASKLDPASLEDIELLNTAKTMLQHANYTMGHISGQSDRIKYSQGQQQKELSKRFIERKLMELKSAK